MNFDALDEIIRKNTNLNICPICGSPFRQYHSRQKTCGDEECKRIWHNKYHKKRRAKKLEENPEAFRAYRREAERKTRKKKKEKEIMSRNYDKLEEYWQKQEELMGRANDGGLDYGKQQIQKTLANVPKIDVSGFGKENKE